MKLTSPILSIFSIICKLSPVLDCPLFDYIYKKLDHDHFDIDPTDFKSLLNLKGLDTTMRNFVLKLYHQKLISPAQRRHIDRDQCDEDRTGLCVSCNENATSFHLLFECENNIRLLSKLEQLYLNSNIINARNLLSKNFGTDKFISKMYYLLFTVYAHCVNSTMTSNKILSWPHLIFSFNLTIKKITVNNNRFKENILRKIEDNLISSSLMHSLNRLA